MNACFVEGETEKCGTGKNCEDLNDFAHNTTAYRCVDYQNVCQEGQVRLGVDTCSGSTSEIFENDCLSDNFYNENGICKCVCNNHYCHYGENCEHQFACGDGSQIWRRNDGSFDCYCVPGYERYDGWFKGMDCNQVGSSDKVMNGISLIYLMNFGLL